MALTDDEPKKKSAGRPFQKGGKNPHRFQPGVSGNPGGRSRSVIPQFMAVVVKRKAAEGRGEFEATRREHLLQGMFALAMNKRDPLRMKAMELLLAYDLGKPRERLEMSGPMGGPIETVITGPRPQTSGELRKEMAALEEIRRKRLAIDVEEAKPEGTEGNGTSNGHAPVS